MLYHILGHYHEDNAEASESIWVKTRSAMQRYNSQRRKDFQWEKLDEEAAQYDFSQAYQSGIYIIFNSSFSFSISTEKILLL